MRIGAGRFKRRKLPEVGAARPAGARLKTSLFSVLQPDLAGARVLDLFAGAGTLGLEALSRGAASLVLVERDPQACRALEAWLAAVGASGEATVIRRDLLRAAPPQGPFELVFFDPPYGLWGTPEGAAAYAAALDAVAVGGLLAVKLPAEVELPADSRARERLRRTASSAAYALLERVDPGTAA